MCFLLPGCAEVKFIGSSRGDFQEVPAGQISPADALKRAGPYLAATQEARCKHTHEKSSRWCADEATTHVVQKGRYYYLSRTDYPYKTFHAYIHYAVKVHVKTGEVIPYGD